MQIEIWLVRHGMTPGNASGRYIGRTDEPLSPVGREQLINRRKVWHRAPVGRLYASPMRRCLETADLLFPGQKPIIVDDFRECDFGAFENKNYEALNGNADYQTWIDSGGTSGFPGGESQEKFKMRVQAAFRQVVAAEIADATPFVGGMAADAWVMVVHGGTIMAILDAYARPHRDYFAWQVKNGGGYVVTLDTEKWQAGDAFVTVKKTLEVD